jgi:hypothetical protein
MNIIVNQFQHINTANNTSNQILTSIIYHLHVKINLKKKSRKKV